MIQPTNILNTDCRTNTTDIQTVTNSADIKASQSHFYLIPTLYLLPSEMLPDFGLV